MELRFCLSGSVLFTTESNVVPCIGSVVRIRTESYKKGLNAGSVIEVSITENDPIVFDYTELPSGVAYIDLNDYKIISEGPEPD